MTKPCWIAFDVGGANIKAAHSNGEGRTLPFELWKRPDELSSVLGALAAAISPCDRVALTMTAELCDCYPTKAVGVNRVLDAVLSALPGRPVFVWGVDERFHEVEEIRDRPLLAAAANWLALANLAARVVPGGEGLLIDIGTTTTDLIPLRGGRVAVQGRTDTERLQTGELVYAGTRRTPVFALATELPFRGLATGLAAELFASTLDVYLTLGEIGSDPKDLSTADGRPATTEAARDRLARMVGADRDGFTAEDALAFARAADEVLLARLESAARKACRAAGVSITGVVVAGSGSFVARRLARRLAERDDATLSLTEAWGDVASTAGCAHALVVLASEQLDNAKAHRP
jgi:probable H4MPT-linked C1 transfer pathway protein